MPVRMLREGILTSERIDMLSPSGEVFYRRLMSVVDDYGRFSANPKLVRAACYPLKLDTVFDEHIAEWMKECASANLVLCYEVAGKQYLEVQDFRQQVRSKVSKYPDPITGASNCLADAKQMQESAHLDEDGDVDGVEDGNSSTDVEVAIGDAESPAKSPIPDCPHQQLIDLYAQHLPELPYPRIWEGERQKSMRTRWRWVLTAKSKDGQRYATDEASAVAWFDRFFAYAGESDFLTGRNGKWGSCDLGWLMKAENFNKVLQGNYENKGSK
jgi:hypothetical protein